jgi:transposase InsO family protein
VVHLQQRLAISERRACRTIGQPRSTQRKPQLVQDDEAALTAAIIRLGSEYGRYGYRRITALLRVEGWRVNAKRVQRIWRREGLKVPARQPKRGRLWLTDGSCIRLRPEYPHHVWAYDFVADRTVEGRPLKMLTVIDEFSRQCLAITVARRLKADDVLATLTELFVKHGPPAFIRSDNGGEFTAGVSVNGSNGCRSKPCISSPAVLGRMATTSRSTASSAMSCSTASSSTHSPRLSI